MPPVMYRTLSSADPSLGYERGGSPTTGRVEDQVTGIRRHEEASGDYFRAGLYRIHFPAGADVSAQSFVNGETG